MYTYYNQPAILKATIAEIRICDRNNKLLYTHKRSYTEFPKYITKQEHMNPEHQYYKEVTAKNDSYYRRWTATYSSYMAKLIDYILLAPKHEEQAYNSCNGILHMCTNTSKIHVEEAAKLCVESNACRYSHFKKVLKGFSESKVSPGDKHKLSEHDNLRGKKTYR